MIPQTDISFDAALVEAGHSTGLQHTLAALLDDFNTYSTGAYHSANSFRHLSGFTGADVWHYLKATSFYDYGDGNIDLNIYNNAVIDTQSAANIYYEVCDSGDNTIGSGNTSVSNVPALSTDVAAVSYIGGTPAYVKWRFSESLGWNIVYPE